MRLVSLSQGMMKRLGNCSQLELRLMRVFRTRLMLKPSRPGLGKAISKTTLLLPSP